ncbi:MAG: ABC transporter ATP-binding protein [Thermoplasmata archaeon]|nr:ABC transporter ATP-binding protein [Thermoplasmata archaeon]
MGDVTITALKNVSVTFNPGELVSITGPSGSGKTTMLNMIGCVDKPTRGRILLDGRDVTNIPLDRLAHLRLKRFGFVFQRFYLLPTLTALQNVMFPILKAGTPRGDAKRRAEELLESVGMGDRKNHLPHQLSGGEQQRVAIARALANNPDVILADEPTGELDSESGRKVIDLLISLNKKMGKSVIIVTHQEEISNRCRRRIRLKDGRIL